MLTWMKSWFASEKPRPQARATTLERRPTQLHRALVATAAGQPMEVVLLSRNEVVLGVKHGKPLDTMLEVRLYNPKTGAVHLSQAEVARVFRGFDGHWQLRCVLAMPLERNLLAALQA
ncbi:MAG: hypothetical protein AB7K24_14815 [Gemmataceae bacterium]